MVSSSVGVEKRLDTLTNRFPTLEENNLPVAIQDQHTEIIDLELNLVLDNLNLLNSYNIGDTVINISTTGVIPTTSMNICLKERVAFYQGDILSITGLGGNNYTLVLDTPLDYAFSVNGGCALTTSNMAVDGSVTPIVFQVTPNGLNSDVEWDITRILFVLAGEGVGVQNDAPDDGDFGVTSVLTNGIVLRSVNSITKNIFNIKRNGEFRLHAYDVTYTPASKQGLYSVGVRRSFSGADKNGVTVRLKASTSDSIEVIVQDDLTEMFGFRTVVQGHMVLK